MRIAVLALAEALTSTVTGPVDVLSTASLAGGHDWRVDIISPSGKPLSCFNGITLTPSASLQDAQIYQLILLPSLVVDAGQGLLSDYRDTICWLQQQSRHGAIIAAICTGTFLLAETGLLDHARATTHWAFADTFRRRYPAVQINPQLTLVDNGNTLCCSAGSAWQDLVLHILQAHLDPAAVQNISDVFQLQRHNTGQLAFCGLPPAQRHDPVVEKAKQVLRENIAHPQAMQLAIAASGLGLRTFQRRFKSSAGVSENRYLQLLRVAKARQMLTFDRLPVEQISEAVGYEDPSYLRRLFKKETGLSMRDYRQRFQKTD